MNRNPRVTRKELPLGFYHDDHTETLELDIVFQRYGGPARELDVGRVRIVGWTVTIVETFQDHSLVASAGQEPVQSPAILITISDLAVGSSQPSVQLKRLRTKEVTCIGVSTCLADFSQAWRPTRRL